MKNKLFFILIAISILYVPIFSQAYKGQGKMKGTVLDEEGKPIPDVTVKLINLKAKVGFDTKTDKKGVWRAFFIRRGQWHVDFIKEGYGIKKITSPNVNEFQGKLVIVDVTLEKIKGPVVSNEILKDYEAGTALYNEKKYKEALVIFNKIIEENPQAYIVNLSVGNCYMKMNDYDMAIKSYKKVIEKEPNNTDVIIAIGNSYSNKKDSKSALKWYAKIDASKIKDPIVLYNIGVFNFNANKSDAAVKFFELAIKADAKYLDAYYQLGLSYLGLGKMKEAVVIFKKYAELDKESSRSKEVTSLIKQLGG